MLVKFTGKFNIWFVIILIILVVIIFMAKKFSDKAKAE